MLFIPLNLSGRPCCAERIALCCLFLASMRHSCMSDLGDIDNDSENPIPLHNVTSQILNIIFEWCNIHKVHIPSQSLPAFALTSTSRMKCLKTKTTPSALNISLFLLLTRLSWRHAMFQLSLKLLWFLLTRSFARCSLHSFFLGGKLSGYQGPSRVWVQRDC